MFKSCGCKICKAGMGKVFNDFVILENPTFLSAKNYLVDNELEADKKLIINHLSAYDLSLNDLNINELSSNKNVDNVVMRNDESLDSYLDFSQYDFEINNPDTVVNYLQKLHLKIHLNQCEILIKSQYDVMSGNSSDMNNDVVRNTALSWKMLNEVSGIGMITNQAKAIQTVESMGYKLKDSKDV